MEKLTIEEKAKRYDEAIEIARALNNGEAVEGENGDTVYECIFHELKESKGEKIRKEILEYIRKATGCKEWIAWLEKQNEQKSNPYSGVSFEYNGHTWGMCARDGGVEICCDKQLIAYVNLPQEKNEFDNLSKVIDNKLTNCNTGDFIMSTAPNHGI